ncbi:Nitrous oxide reductase maturation transmembrane protein NosY [hydrothermal vent metagenome]|uniref:Nitrous oxide reductase maturation transmembrane protein NosY n=1 Tax=hydrothermal vent metagenome TaxID=652676 RepID=A0A3B0RYQ6_9ZZZZ
MWRCLAIGYISSILARQGGTAAALAVSVWLISVVLYDLVLLGALVPDAGGYFSKTIFPWLLLANPADAFRLFNMTALELGSGATGLSELETALPFGTALPLIFLFGWIALALSLADIAFRRLQP